MKKSQISNFLKIRVVGVELLHADRETDRRMDGNDEDSNRFSKFCERA